MGLAVIPTVSLVMWAPEHMEVIGAAEKWAKESGLPLPATLRVRVQRVREKYDAGSK